MIRIQAFALGMCRMREKRSATIEARFSVDINQHRGEQPSPEQVRPRFAGERPGTGAKLWEVQSHYTIFTQGEKNEPQSLYSIIHDREPYAFHIRWVLLCAQ